MRNILWTTAMRSPDLNHACDVVTDELIQSRMRCHVPYTIVVSPCQLPEPAQNGLSLIIESQVFGRIASVSDTTLGGCLSKLATELDSTRDSRAVQETESVDPALGQRASKAALIAPLLTELKPMFDREGYTRSADVEVDNFVIYSRQKPGFIERVAFSIHSSANSKGTYRFGVILGLQFDDLEPDPYWIGMPATHDNTTLAGLIPDAPDEFVVRKSMSLRKLLGQLAEWIPLGCAELETRRAEFRQRYISHVEALGWNAMDRLKWRAESMETVELRDIISSSRKKGGFGSDLNFFEAALHVLEGTEDTVEEVESYEFHNDVDAHDDGLQDRLEKTFAKKASAIDDELRLVFGIPRLLGEEDHEIIPCGGVIYFAAWRVGWNWLYVAAFHEDRELPYLLVIGAKKAKAP